MRKSNKWHVYTTDATGSDILIATIVSEGLVNLFCLRFADLYPVLKVVKA